MGDVMLHWIIQARPAAAILGPTVSLMGHELPTLTVSEAERGLPLAVSFDTAAVSMSQHPRIYYEPDGSFAWTPSPECRIQGTLVDGRTHLQHIEVWGTPTAETLRELCGWMAENPAKELMFQIVQSGVFVPLDGMQRLVRS